MRKTTSGFTIIELIIVIVVIGILAAITIVAYYGFQDRAKAAVISDGLKSAEKGLRAYASEKQWSSWPRDNAIDPSIPAGNPTIQNLITDLPGLSAYITTAPSASGLPASVWTYDYDGDTKSSCGTLYNGTNFVITGVTQSVASNVDSQIDDGDNNCGRIRYDASALKLFYSLSYTNDLSL
jgi:prepilin-type N-terminal cleavage/methylation domain-containing protein